MLNIGKLIGRNCQGLTRREILQVGSLGAIGLTLPDWLRSQQAQANPRPRVGDKSRELSCITIWLTGGPSHLETFDPKPDARDFVRGPYGAIRTKVPGIQISELLPMIAAHADKWTLIRSMTVEVVNTVGMHHSPYVMLTGGSPRTGTAHGAVVTRFKGCLRDMPPYVHLGAPFYQQEGGPKVGGGSLGVPFHPLEIRDPVNAKTALAQFSLTADITADRLQQRQALLGTIDRLRAAVQASPAVEQMDTCYQRAMDLLTSSKVREAFDLGQESSVVRNRYGAHMFGQSALMARRLVEAGTRFVQINWPHGNDRYGQDWDIHGINGGLIAMEQQLCPRLDQGLSALLEDLQERGLLRSTLVLVTGEFGRKPRVQAMGDSALAGRDHWPPCGSVLLAGGGVPGGTLVGASDREGAYPIDRPVKPPELAATLYRLFGIETNTDPRLRPFIGDAMPIAELV